MRPRLTFSLGFAGAKNYSLKKSSVFSKKIPDLGQSVSMGARGLFLRYNGSVIRSCVIKSWSNPALYHKPPESSSLVSFSFHFYAGR
jgi:hypothetical protein